ncbi:ABC transporter ATP-binding protein [Blautia producta]|uniref:ABC transporter ATP-binding protein n=1 Tax=Blautia producta TaxID=33035 RepID=UPI0031B63344
MGIVIETSSLTKQYGKKQVVKDLDLKVPGGCIYGFLGPNGAGKSTTMKMILGLAKPTAGTVTVLGKTVNNRNRLSILKDTGSLIESPSYYGHLSGRENLQIICTLKQVPENAIDEVLQTVRMKKQQYKKVGQYSLGMKQRLGLAAALLGHPRILLLDEPTNGLDPAGIQEMRELICTLPSRYGMTVLVSSHLLSEMDQMATHVGIISKGSLVFQDKLANLHEHSKARMKLRTTDDRQSFLFLKHSGLPVMMEKENLFLSSDRDEDILRAGSILVENKLGILRLEEQQKSLEDIFLNLTGRSISL